MPFESAGDARHARSRHVCSLFVQRSTSLMCACVCARLRCGIGHVLLARCLLPLNATARIKPSYFARCESRRRFASRVLPLKTGRRLFSARQKPHHLRLICGDQRHFCVRSPACARAHHHNTDKQRRRPHAAAVTHSIFRPTQLLLSQMRTRRFRFQLSNGGVEKHQLGRFVCVW